MGEDQKPSSKARTACSTVIVLLLAFVPSMWLCGLPHGPALVTSTASGGAPSFVEYTFGSLLEVFSAAASSARGSLMIHQSAMEKPRSSLDRTSARARIDPGRMAAADLRRPQ